jgi:hypothetical protein
MNPRLLRLSCLSTFAALALAAAPGCKKNEPTPGTPTPAPGTVPAAAAVKVTEVQLGNELGTDKRVKTALTTFSAKDTIFASVVTEGSAPAAELSARWTFGDGQLVKEDRRSIVPKGHDVTEFSIQKPDGWPAGDYKVDIGLDGKPAETRTFKVAAKGAATN